MMRRAENEQCDFELLSERELKLIRLRWTLRYLRPRTPAERAEMRRQVEDRVRKLTAEEKAACKLRRAIAQSSMAPKH